MKSCVSVQSYILAFNFLVFIHHTNFFQSKGDGLFYSVNRKGLEALYKTHLDSFYLGVRDYVTPYNIASRKKIIFQ